MLSHTLAKVIFPVIPTILLELSSAHTTTVSLSVCTPWIFTGRFTTIGFTARYSKDLNATPGKCIAVTSRSINAVKGPCTSLSGYSSIVHSKRTQDGWDIPGYPSDFCA